MGLRVASRGRLEGHWQHSNEYKTTPKKEITKSLHNPSHTCTHTPHITKEKPTSQLPLLLDS